MHHKINMILNKLFFGITFCSYSLLKLNSEIGIIYMAYIDLLPTANTKQIIDK